MCLLSVFFWFDWADCCLNLNRLLTIDHSGGWNFLFFFQTVVAFLGLGFYYGD